MIRIRRPLLSFAFGIAIAGIAAAAARAQEAPALERDARIDASAESPAARDASWREASLSLFGDQAFKKRFIESYVAETEIEPRVTEAERKFRQKALAHISADERDQAMKILEKELTPASSAVVDFTLANLHFQNDALDRAAALYASAVDKHPKFRRAWKNLAVIHVRGGDYKKALPELTRVIELGGGDAITYGLLAYSYASVEDHLAAETAYRMAILLDPATPDWKSGLARSLFKQRRHADASALCDALLAADPGRADLWLLQANAFLGMEKALKAAENYEIVDRLGKSTPETLNMLGDIYVNEGLYDVAVARYVRALDVDAAPKLDRPIRAAKALTARGARQETKTLLDRLDRGFADALSVEQRKDVLKLKARLAVAEGAGDEEARVLKEVVKLDPLDGDALLLLGQHAAKSGDAERAVFYYRQAASLEAFEADAKVRHAQLLVGQGKYAEALPLLRRAQSLKPRENVQKYLESVERAAPSKG
jgi:tetratricopeptide (TPR) repeat protein